MSEHIPITATQAYRLAAAAGAQGDAKLANRSHIREGEMKGRTFEVEFTPPRHPGQREVCRLLIGGLRSVKLYPARAREYLKIHEKETENE